MEALASHREVGARVSTGLKLAVVWGASYQLTPAKPLRGKNVDIKKRSINSEDSIFGFEAEDISSSMVLRSSINSEDSIFGFEVAACPPLTER